jgi:TonB family protein
MPTLLIPPNPPRPDESQPDAARGLKVRTGRFGELEEHELIHLLDALDDDRARSRFRESIYISVIVYLALAWFLFYGPRVIFHQHPLIDPATAIRQHEKDLTFLNMPPDVAKQLQHKPTDKIAEKAHTAQTARPTIDKKTLDAMRRAAPAPQPSPAPTPAPPAPQPQQAAPQAPAPQPLRQLPQSPQTAMVEAPKPQPKINFGGSQSAGTAIEQAARAAQGGGGGADYDHPQGSHGGLNTGVDVLSDTEGVDFGPYLQRILREIRQTWLPLIPEEARPPLNKQGVTQIRFTILPDGKIGGMLLEGSTHDDALNRAAWGSITGVGQFPPLPGQFKGPNLELRIHFLVNKTQE